MVTFVAVTFAGRLRTSKAMGPWYPALRVARAFSFILPPWAILKGIGDTDKVNGGVRTRLAGAAATLKSRPFDFVAPTNEIGNCPIGALAATFNCAFTSF